MQARTPLPNYLVYQHQTVLEHTLYHLQASMSSVAGLGIRRQAFSRVEIGRHRRPKLSGLGQLVNTGRLRKKRTYLGADSSTSS